MPFEYSFLDRDFDNLYVNEKQTRKLFVIFSILAIFIACLGLFGLASFIADRKTKEIGIRKVLGASVPSIMGQMSLNFTKWVILSNIIAWPLAWFIMSRWLQNFPYRIDIGIWIFIGSGFLALIIALFTVSYQAIKSALANPADALRCE
jgi:putative ABC transport system permease protein